MIQIDLTPDIRKLRQFGWFGLIGFGVIGFMAYHKFGSINAAIMIWSLAIVAPLLGLFAPKALKPLYLVLTVVAFPIGFIISHLVLGILFYGVFTPVGLFFRLIGRDSLSRSITGKEETHWNDKGPARPPRDYYRQF